MEKILLELIKSDDPYSRETHRRIASICGSKTATVEAYSIRFHETLEQIEMLRNQLNQIVHPETKELLERQKREMLCPLPTAAEWREADARSMAAWTGTDSNENKAPQVPETEMADIGELTAIEKARLQEIASSRDLIAYQSLASQMRIKYARP